MIGDARSGFLTRAIAQERPERFFEVFNLEPAAGIPDDYSRPLTAAELTAIRRDCIKKGGPKCKPIPEGQLPSTRRFYTTWSLFLISNPSWLTGDSSEKITSLYNSYLGFARATGGQHAAVWFWKKAPKIEGEKVIGADLAANIDTDRCTVFTRKLNLDIAKSPHVLVTTSYPSLQSRFKDYIVLELGGLRPESTVDLLTVLGDQLLQGKLDQKALNSKLWWLGWKDAASKTLVVLSELAAHVKFKIKTSVLDITIDGKK